MTYQKHAYICGIKYYQLQTLTVQNFEFNSNKLNVSRICASSDKFTEEKWINNTNDMKNTLGE
jgi:hypothetical protein